MTPQDIQSLFAYNAWANQRTLAACRQISPDQFTREIGGSFRSLRDLLVHIAGVEWLYLERWHGRSPTALPWKEGFATLESIESLWNEVERELLARVAALTPEALDHPLPFRNTQGNVFSQSLAQVLQHLVNHSTYHRGQVATALRQLGGKAQGTDLIAFYRERDAAAQA
jgi:uncharacterized damage-inducible protein DinB